MVIQYESHDVFAATSHSHTEHWHRKIVAILDVAVAFFRADMDDVMYAHPPAEAQPDRTDVWLSIKAGYGTGNASRLWQEFLRNEVLMKAGWDAVAEEPRVYHRAGSLGERTMMRACVSTRTTSWWSRGSMCFKT